MPEIEVIIFNQKLKLSYQENEKLRLINAVETLNKSWSKFSDLHSKVSNLKIITLISLELQDSIISQQILKDKDAESASKIELLKKDIATTTGQLEESLSKIKKFEEEVNEKNQDLSKVELILDELNIEIINIKNNILKNQDE